MKQNNFENELAKMSRLESISVVKIFIVLIVVSVTSETVRGSKWEEISEDQTERLSEDLKEPLGEYINKKIEEISILEAYHNYVGPDNDKYITWERLRLDNQEIQTHMTLSVIGKTGKPIIQYTHQTHCH